MSRRVMPYKNVEKESESFAVKHTCSSHCNYFTLIDHTIHAI